MFYFPCRKKKEKKKSQNIRLQTHIFFFFFPNKIINYLKFLHLQNAQMNALKCTKMGT